LPFVVPNYFIENKHPNLHTIDKNLLCVKYISKTKNNSIYARTTMHSIIILLEGSKTIYNNEQEIDVTSDEISFISQNNYYMSERMTKNLKYKSLILYFDDQFIFDFIQKYPTQIMTKEEKNIVKVHYKKDTFFNQSVINFQEYLDKNFDPNLIKLKIQEIFLHALRVDKSTTEKFINSVLSTSKDRVRYILESNIDIIHTLDEMCHLTQLSQSKIRKYIKNEYNMTPKVWLDTQRLNKALLLLKTTDKTISHISTECGYATVSWFISQFKKHHNLTPKEFRYKL